MPREGAGLRRVRLFFWWTLLVGALAVVFIYSYVPAELRVWQAREEYDAARAMLEDVTRQRAELEGRLTDLYTRVDSVELGARSEYRLIRPGERLEILELRPARDSSVATARPPVPAR